MSSPPWAEVPRNEWQHLTPPELGQWTPTDKVSVIVPHYEGQARLELLLASLLEQTYPRALLEVIVADDGSRVPPQLPGSIEGLRVRVVAQPHRGFGAGRARNLGARTAGGQILLFADGDTCLERETVEAHARWHHLVGDAVVQGVSRHVDFSGITPERVRTALHGRGLKELVPGRPEFAQTWMQTLLRTTKDFQSGAANLASGVYSLNLSMRASTFHGAGGFEPSFDQWGYEDTEFGYRLLTWGAILIPDRQARFWHQDESGSELDNCEVASLRLMAPKIANLVPAGRYRRHGWRRTYRVPYVSLRVPTRDVPAWQISRVTNALLSDAFHDLSITLAMPPDHPEERVLRWEFEDEPRVRFLPEDAADPHPASLVVGTWPAQVIPERGFRLERHLRDFDGWCPRNAGLLELTVGSGERETSVRLYARRAWHRAQRIWGSAQGDITDVRAFDQLVHELGGSAQKDGGEHGLRLAPASITGANDPARFPADAGSLRGLLPTDDLVGRALGFASAFYLDAHRRGLRTAGRALFSPPAPDTDPARRAATMQLRLETAPETLVWVMPRNRTGRTLAFLDMVYLYGKTLGWSRALERSILPVAGLSLSRINPRTQFRARRANM